MAQIMVKGDRADSHATREVMMKVTRSAVAVGLVVVGTLIGGQAFAQSKCTGLKYKFAGKTAFLKSKCYLKAAKKGLAVDQTCLDDADAFLFAKLTKAELKADCPPGDPVAVDGVIDAFIDGLKVNFGEPGPATCGNNSQEVGEVCDGTDDAACLGLCQSDCTCGEPQPAPCGDGGDFPTCGGSCPVGEVCQAYQFVAAGFMCEAFAANTQDCQCVPATATCSGSSCAPTSGCCAGTAPFSLGPCPVGEACTFISFLSFPEPDNLQLCGSVLPPP